MSIQQGIKYWHQHVGTFFYLVLSRKHIFSQFLYACDTTLSFILNNQDCSAKQMLWKRPQRLLTISYKKFPKPKYVVIKMWLAKDLSELRLNPNALYSLNITEVHAVRTLTWQRWQFCCEDAAGRSKCWFKKCISLTEWEVYGTRCRVELTRTHMHTFSGQLQRDKRFLLSHVFHSVFPIFSSPPLHAFKQMSSQMWWTTSENKGSQHLLLRLWWFSILWGCIDKNWLRHLSFLLCASVMMGVCESRKPILFDSKWNQPWNTD